MENLNIGAPVLTSENFAAPGTPANKLEERSLTPRLEIHTLCQMITVTEMAVRHLQQMLAEKGEPSKALRIFVEQGGCAGMQYGMTLDPPAPEDAVYEESGVKVVIDQESLNYLRGSTLDYCDDLTGTGFRLLNPNAVRSCGCGTSFEAPEGSVPEGSVANGAPHAH